MAEFHTLLEIAGRKTWKFPELTGLNKLPPHATFYPFPSVQAAISTTREQSPWFLPLNGTWDFQIFSSPGEAASNKATSGVWKSIQVPGNWTMQGFGHPHYTNVVMPFPNLPPEVPDVNPTGCYRRLFDIPSTWSGQRVVLHFGGCEGALYVFLNNLPVGISKDARTPAEFDITDSCRFTGENELIVLVVQWSDASFMEDQDHWWQAGLQREVYIYSTTDPYIKDIFAIADLVDDYQNGNLRFSVKIGSHRTIPADTVIEAQLYDPQNQPVFSTGLIEEYSSHVDAWHAMISPSNEINFEQLIPHVMPWTAETPNLYTLIVSLKSPAGEQSTRCMIGFRKIEIRDRMLLVNGKRPMIKGVNYHDHDDSKGKVISIELFEKDLHLMKQFNVNAIRTSHYPKDAAFYDMCDRLGFYVIDEANIETHAFYQDLCHDPAYTNAFVERVQSMVERDKNHPCIILWSLGNESGYGPNHDAAAGYVRGADLTRPLHYEGAIGHFWGGKGWQDGQRVTDVVCPMYPSIEDIISWSQNSSDNRPMILCEYSHCMGNSNGSLSDYWAAFEKYTGLQGGFLWEWIDHGILQHDPAGIPYWAYGGDFNDVPNDANFCIDGIVWPDRIPHPALFEFKYLAQPIRVELVDADACRFCITNRQDYLTSGWLSGTWELTFNGDAIAGGKLPALDIPAHASEVIELPINPIDYKFGEYFINFHFYQRQSTEWAPAEHEIAWEQIPLHNDRDLHLDEYPILTLTHGPDLIENGDLVFLTNGAVKATFARRTGELIEFGMGTNLLIQGPLLNIWRAPTDNDGIKQLSDRTDETWKVLSYWKSLGLPDLHFQLISFHVITAPDNPVSIVITHQASGRDNWDDFTHIHRYTLLPSGELVVSNDVKIGNGILDLPRVGVSLTLIPGLENLIWYGRGPWENYPDRQASAMVGLYQSSVGSQYTHYIMPQENGHRTGVRWLSLCTHDGKGMKIKGFPSLEFNASHFTANDLYAAQHTYELKPRQETWLYLDHTMRGLGTASCGPDTRDEYRLLKSSYQFQYSLEPIIT